MLTTKTGVSVIQKERKLKISVKIRLSLIKITNDKPSINLPNFFILKLI